MGSYLFLDIGLVKQASKLSAEILLQKNLLLINRGAIAEQFVGQELLAYQPPYTLGHLFYWERDKPGSNAEVDYVISVDGAVYPIEVKARTAGHLKSLYLFMTEKNALLESVFLQHRCLLKIKYYQYLFT